MTSVNVAAHLSERAQLHPEKTAIQAWHQGFFGGRYHALSYGELDRDSDEIARGLTAIGIGRGVRTVLMVPPSRDFFALAFGMAKAGVVPVLIDPGMGIPSLAQCIAEAAPEAFIGIARAHLARIALGWGRGSIRKLVSIGGFDGFGLFGGFTLDDVRGAGRAATGPALVDSDHDEVAAILFTSGSTGVPKGVVYTHGNFDEQVQSLRRISMLGNDEVDLATFAPFALFDPALGMTTVVPPMDFTRPAAADPARIMEAITRFGATNMFCSPALLGGLVRWALQREAKLPTLRRVISAGAPVSIRVIEQLVSLLGKDARVLTPYGATEALPVSLIDGDELLGEVRQRNAAGAGVCVGRAVEGVELAVIPISDAPIARWDESLRLPSGELGELVVRGRVVTQTYFARSEDTTLAKIAAEGTAWHRMGDLGYVDEQQRIWFCGRKSERVELLERTLCSVQVEAVFDVHPEVKRTALVGVKREDDLEPVLCVELAPGAGSSRRKLEAELRALGAAHPHTAAITSFLFHAAFPVDTRHNAKIRRAELAEWAAAKLS